MAALIWAASAHAGGHEGHGSHGDPNGAAPAVMEAITVTAERISEYIQNHPQDVSVMRREDIQERNFRSVEETLGAMPGVEVRSSAGMGSRISIRGSGKTGGVLVLLNGRPLNSSQYGGADLSTIPIDIVSSVAVFKPPVPVWLGAGASEGVISILTHETAVSEKAKNRASVSAGSWGFVEASAGREIPLDKGSVMVTAAGSHKDGKRENSDGDKGDVSLHWDHATAGDVRFDVNARYYLSEYGSAGPTDNSTPDARQHYEKGSFDAKAKGFLGESGEYDLQTYADRVALTDESQSGFTSDLTEVKVGLKGDTTWSDESELWTLRLGGILEHDDVDHTLSGEHQRVTAGGHAQFDHRFGALTATAGLRLDHTDDFGLNPGASGGLSYALTENLLIRGNTGYTVTVPNFGQLYQPAHGSIDQVRGNPDLDEEKIFSHDLGLEYRLRKDRVFQVTLFRSDTHDPIVYRRGPDLVFQPDNADRAWRHGLELTGRYTWDMGLSLDLSAILQDSENRDTGKELAYTPRCTVKGTLRYTIPRWDTRLEAVLRHEGERYGESEGREDMRLNDYATMDLKILHPFMLSGVKCEAWLHLFNLLDRNFEVHYGYPDDGRRFVTGLNLNW